MLGFALGHVQVFRRGVWGNSLPGEKGRCGNADFGSQTTDPGPRFNQGRVSSTQRLVRQQLWIEASLWQPARRPSASIGKTRSGTTVPRQYSPTHPIHPHLPRPSFLTTQFCYTRDFKNGLIPPGGFRKFVRAAATSVKLQLGSSARVDSCSARR